MIIANIETFPLRVPCRSSTGAAASAWGDKRLPVLDSLLGREPPTRDWKALIAPLSVGRCATQVGPLIAGAAEETPHFRASGPLFYGISGYSAVDFVQPSVAKMGGITELLKVIQIAAVQNVTVMPRCFYDSRGLLGAIHATAALGTSDSMD